MNRHSFCQCDFPEQTSMYLTGEICCFDPECADVAILRREDTCHRSISDSVNHCTGISRRLLPRRPRIGEGRPSNFETKVQRSNNQHSDLSDRETPDVSIEGERPKTAVLKKSLSLEPELLSVAGKRYLEIQGLSARLPHHLPPFSQRIPVAGSRSSNHLVHTVEKNKNQRRISIFDLPKSKDCKNIFLRANLGPLRASGSQKEREEFEEWRRKFYAPINKKTIPKESASLTLECSGDAMFPCLSEATTTGTNELTPSSKDHLDPKVLFCQSQPSLCEDSEKDPGGSDFQLIKGVNRRRYLFSAPVPQHRIEPQSSSREMTLPHQTSQQVKDNQTKCIQREECKLSICKSDRKSVVMTTNLMEQRNLLSNEDDNCPIKKDWTQDEESEWTKQNIFADGDYQNPLYDEFVEDVSESSKSVSYECTTKQSSYEREKDTTEFKIRTKKYKESLQATQKSLQWKGSRRDGKVEATLDAKQERFLRVIRKRL